VAFTTSAYRFLGTNKYVNPATMLMDVNVIYLYNAALIRQWCCSKLA